MEDCKLSIDELKPVTNLVNNGQSCAIGGFNIDNVACGNLNITTTANISGNVLVNNINSPSMILNGGLGVAKKSSIGGNLTSIGTISRANTYNINPTLVLPADTMNVTNMSGFSSNQLKWTGGVLAPNGKIYCAPFADPNILVIDPITGTTSTIGVKTGNNKWWGGVLAPNGKIYFIPDAATSILIFDPETNVVDMTTMSGVPSGSLGGWYGGVLHPDGKIYCPPYGTFNVLIIDPNTNTYNITDIQGLNNGVELYGSSHKWVGGALAPNGKIYCMPMLENKILIIDPTSPVTNLSGSGNLANASYNDTTKTFTWTGVTLNTILSVGDNLLITTATASYTGYILTIPTANTATFVYYLGGTVSTPINIPAGSITSLQKTRKADITTLSVGGDWRYVGCVLAPNGNIYGIPFDNNFITVINTATDTTSSINVPDIPFYGNNYRGGVLAQNGKIYCIPHKQNKVMIIDPATNTYSFITNIDLTTAARKWTGGVLAPNGVIYGVPWDATSILQIMTGLRTEPSWMLGAHFNKF